ncbi:MAG: hypothetical protein AB7U85_10620, partial [Alphaproteobacteria bacterium]
LKNSRVAVSDVINDYLIGEKRREASKPATKLKLVTTPCNDNRNSVVAHKIEKRSKFGRMGTSYSKRLWRKASGNYEI